MDRLFILAGLAALWWLLLSAATAAIIGDSRERQGRPFDRTDALAITLAPVFWFQIILEALRSWRAPEISGDGR